MKNLSRKLFAEQLAAFPTLPVGVSHPPYQSTGIDFFPGGSGMCVLNEPFPVGGVMILGHNYGSDLDFEKYVQSPETSWRDSVWPTCRSIWRALVRWGIDPETCFFTNFYPGYVTTRDRYGKPFNTGPHPHKFNSAFVDASREFFVRQVQVQKPRAVLVLGTEVPPLLAPLDRRLRAWSPWRNYAPLDASGASILRDLTIGGHTLNMCVVTHPCLPNARLRRYGTLEGREAEDAMVRAALEALPQRSAPIAEAHLAR